MSQINLRRIRNPTRSAAVWIPSRRIEYGFYFAAAYSILAAYFNIEIPLVAAGIFVALSLFCFKHLGSHVGQVLGPIALLLGCLVSFILVQVAVYGAPITGQDIRDFILWACGMVIVQSLCLRRGFLYRC